MPPKKLNSVSIPLSRLKVGVILRAPVSDETGVLLIASGQQLTAAALEKLKERGVRNVLVNEKELARVTGSGGPVSAAGMRAALGLELPAKDSGTDEYSSKNAVIHKLKKPAAANPTAERAAEFSERFEESIVNLESVYSELAAGKQVNQKVILDTVQRAMEQIIDDFDFFAALAVQGRAGKYPFNHSLQVANLAMAVGVVLELDEMSLAELGIGCMLHDLGMLRIAPKLLNCDRPLDVIEKLDITKHPAMTFDMIGNICGIALGSRMVAYQMHERLDGSGYPRKRTASQIHPFSKIAMVCDAFVAMTSPRPHRAAIPPYCAMVELIEMGQIGKLDSKAVRGLLYTVSLFPLGSYVTLSDGRIAKVLRSNREKFAQPVVEAWDPNNPDERETVNLPDRDDLSILHSLLPSQVERAGRSPSGSQPELATTAASGES
jgi:HD-GYP domain-containing protein (c-di-GMP phosphodiesterase class II)